jgi:hypothetical protein
LEKLIVTDDDPAVLFNWEIASVNAFVAAANAFPQVAQPHWITTAPGAMTTHSIMSDIIAHLAQVGGGRTAGVVLLAPNTLSQFGNIRARLSHIEAHPFVQMCSAQFGQNQILAAVYQLADRKIIRAEPMGCIAPPPPNRQLFM